MKGLDVMKRHFMNSTYVRTGGRLNGTPRGNGYKSDVRN